MGYEFLVNSSVLIPRFDTEVLVEETIKHIMPGCRLLDVCTGSGCILLSLLEECKDRISAATGVDISKMHCRLQLQTETGWDSQRISERVICFRMLREFMM